MSSGLSYTSKFGLGFSGGRTFAPVPATLFGANLYAWYDAYKPDTMFSDDAATTQAGIVDQIAVWKDRSGNGRNVIQTTSAARPLKQTINSRPRVSFISSDYLQNAAFGFGAATLTVIIVGELTATTGAYGRILSLKSDSNVGDHDNIASVTIGRFATNQQISFFRNSGTDPVSVPAYDTTFVYASVWGPSSNYSRMDATTTVAGSVTGTFDGDLLSLGRGGDFTTDMRYLVGGLREVIIVDRLVDDTEWGTIRTHMASKWGTP